MQNKDPINSFFRKITDKLDNLNVSIIIVTHILPDRPNFLKALSEVGHIEFIIPKPNSIDQSTLSSISNKYPFVHLHRNNLSRKNILPKLFRKVKNKFVILDMGGYFALNNPEITNLYKTGKLLGIVEDTENGIQKYEKLPKLHCPVISVARSSLKYPEDLFIGDSIVFSTEFILRRDNMLLNDLDVGLIGYGKIGSSIAARLRSKDINVKIYDIDPTRIIIALSNAYTLKAKQEILKNSDVIFCATGNKSLTKKGYPLIKNGCNIACITSADDEIDILRLKRNYSRKNIDQYKIKYYNNTNYFYLINDGNAVNFLHNAVIGKYIYLVQSEILYAIKLLLKPNLKNKIYEVSADDRRKLARIWLQSFKDQIQQ